MKRILVAVLLFLGISSFADDINLWKKSTLNQIVQRGELRVGMEPGYMPFEMKDKKGNIIGFDVDIARLIAKGMGVKLKLIPTAWDGILGGLIAGKYDMIMSGMTITQERNLKVNFANSIVYLGQTMIVAKKHEGKTWKDLDDPKYTIVTKLGVTGEIATRKMFKKAKIRTFETEADGAQEVINGNADAFVYDKPYNLLFMVQKGGSNIVHFDKELTYEPIGWAIRKGDPDFLNWLNNFIGQIKGDGKYDILYNKWFKNDSWLKKVK